MTAAREGDIVACARALAQGVEVNAKNKNGLSKSLFHCMCPPITYIHFSVIIHTNIVADVAAECSKPMVELFILNGADLTAKDEIGNTPLHCAAVKGIPWS